MSLGHLVAFFFLAYIIFSFPSSRFVEKYGLRAGILVESPCSCVHIITHFASARGLASGGWKFNTLPWTPRHFGCRVPVCVSGSTCRLPRPAVFCKSPASDCGVVVRKIRAHYGNDNSGARIQMSYKLFMYTSQVNSNQFGIAVVYFLAPTMVHTPMDIPDYLDVLTLTSLVLALAATLYFPPGPPTPPSRSKDVGGSEKLDVRRNQTPF